MSNLFNSTKVTIINSDGTAELKAVQIEPNTNLPVNRVTVDGTITYLSTPVYQSGFSIPNGSLKVGFNDNYTTTITDNSITTSSLSIENNGSTTMIDESGIKTVGTLLAANIPFAWLYLFSGNGTSWTASEKSANITNMSYSSGRITGVTFDTYTQRWINSFDNRSVYCIFIGDHRLTSIKGTNWSDKEYDPAYFGSALFVLLLMV